MKFIADWDSKPQKDEWTGFVLDALETYGDDLLSVKDTKDSSIYCPKFKTLNLDQKKQFYLMLISAMAKRESGFNPNTSYKESFKDVDGTYVVSRGLLQISKTSANSKAYQGDIKDAKQLYDPKTNLIVGVKILNKWIPQDEYFGGNSKNSKLGAGRYWSVMRPGSSQKYIISRVMTLDICKS